MISNVEENTNLLFNEDTIKKEINLFINNYINLLDDSEGIYIYTYLEFKKKYPYISSNLNKIIKEEIKNITNNVKK